MADLDKASIIVSEQGQENETTELGSIVQPDSGIQPKPGAPPEAGGFESEEPKLKSVTERKSIGQPEPGSQPRLVAEPESGSQPRLVAEPESGSQPRLVAEPESGSQPRLVAEPESGSQPRLVAEPESGSQPGLLARSESGSQPKSTVRQPGSFDPNQANGNESVPETGRPKPAKRASFAIRFSQLLLFLFGLGWAILGVPHGHLDEMQIPGFLIAMSISWWLTPEIRSRALHLKLVDMPGEERRIHKVPVPRLGGVAIFISILFTCVFLIALAGRLPKAAATPEGIAGIAVGGTLVFVLGLLDDLESLRASKKFLVQILAACAAYSLGVRIKAIPIPLNMDINLGFTAIHGGVPIELGWFSLPITVLWLVGVANAVNLIDGMDGLAAGVSAISALTIWSVALGASIDKPYAALMAAILAGALFGFLRWNFNPARIFLGDSGAYLVGFILGAISITGVIKGAAAATVIVPTVLLVVLILFFPLLDTSWAVVRRMAAGRSIFSPDAGHIHHRLLQAGLSQKKVAYLIYGVSAVLGLIAAFLVNQHWYYLGIGAAVLVMALFFSEILNRHRQRGNAKSESESQ